MRCALTTLICLWPAGFVFASEITEQAGPLAVGDTAPDATFTGIDGKEFKISEILDGGKHLVLIPSRGHW